MPDTKPPVKGGNFLNKKVGGIKGKWWLVGGVGTAGIAYLMYVRNANATVDDEYSTAGTDDYAYDQEAYGGGNAGGYYDGYGSTGFGTGSAGSSPPIDSDGLDGLDGLDGEDGLDGDMNITLVQEATPMGKTNRQWQHDAIDALERHGYTAHQAKTAIAQYLAGIPLSDKDYGVITAAVRLVGAPPQGAPVVHHEPPKTQRAAATKKKTDTKKKPAAKKKDEPKKKKNVVKLELFKPKKKKGNK